MSSSLFSRRSWAFAFAALCCALWGSAYPAIKSGYALLGVAPSDTAAQLVFAGWRFLIAGVLLVGLAVALRLPAFALNGRQVARVSLLGLVQTSVQYVFFYIGVAHATGVKSSIMNATGVFFSVLLAHFIYADDRLGVAKVAGCLLGMLGVVVVNLGRGALGFDFALLGEGFVVVAALVLSAASIYGKRLSRTLDPVVMTGWQLLIGGAALVAAGMLAGGRLHGIGPASMLLLLYLALLSAVAFSLWSILLKHNPVGLIAPFNFLIPVFGVLLSALFLHESFLRWNNAVALALVCAGIWLVTRRDVPARSPETIQDNRSAGRGSD
jgi:drug/metabolite transporter (DMT)-like permease